MRAAAMIERERDGAVEELRGIAGEGDGELSEEQRARVDQLRAQVEGLEADATRARFIEGLQTRSAETEGEPVGEQTGDSGEGREYREAMGNFSMLRAIGSEMGMKVDAGRETKSCRRCGHGTA